MKKIFFALAAVAALAACSKVEATYEQNVEISFNPVAANRTKAMLSGTTFPEEQFNVWGYYKQIAQGKTIAEWMASSLEQQEYIVEKPFTKKAEGLWGGVTSYFWPKVGSLMFVGYYPTSAASNVDYVFNATESKMTVTDYVAGDYQSTGYVDIHTTTSHTEDLMYFNMTPTSYNSTTQSSVDVVGNNVDVVFRHALSWINVVLVKDVDAPADAEITVHSVKFTSVLPQGDAVVDNTPDALTDEIVWTPEGTEVNVEVCPNDDAATPFVESDVVLTTAENTLGKQPIFIPQTMAGNLVVKYTISSTDGSKFTETKSVNLRGLAGNGAWQPGKKYTYTITIGTSEILIDPAVTDWTPVGVEVPIV